MSERFYSEEGNGDVTVHEANGSKRPLGNRFDYRRVADERAAQRLPRAPLAFNLLADALESERLAGEVHEYFTQRVMPLLPRRFTISRSRVLAFAALIDAERRAKNRF